MSTKNSNTNNEKYDYPMMGERIKQMRESLNLSQKDFASSVGCSQGAISKYEKGMMPSVDILFRISDLVNKSVEWIWHGTQCATCVSEQPPDPYISSVSEMMRSMDDDTKKDIQLSVQKEKLLRDLIKERQEQKAA